MAADLRQDPVSTPLAALPRFRRPGAPPRTVQSYLAALVSRLAVEGKAQDADDVLAYCHKATARTVGELPAWVHGL